MQALRDQWHDLARHIDGRFDVPGIREVSGHINSTHVGFESFRIINRKLGHLSGRGFDSQLFQQSEISVASNQNKNYVVWDRPFFSSLSRKGNVLRRDLYHIPVENYAQAPFSDLA